MTAYKIEDKKNSLMYFLQNSSTTILLSEAGVTKIHKEAKDIYIYIYKIGIRLFIEKIISLSEKVKEHAFKDDKFTKG